LNKQNLLQKDNFFGQPQRLFSSSSSSSSDSEDEGGRSARNDRSFEALNILEMIREEKRSTALYDNQMKINAYFKE